MAQCEKTATRGMKALAEAQRFVRAHYGPAVAVRTVPLGAARNRVLATNLVASVDLPLHDSAAMDGFAIRATEVAGADSSRLRLVGRAAAGHPFAGTVADGEAVRIFTGAPLPRGANAVAVQEICGFYGDSIVVGGSVQPGANHRRQGEDVSAGSVVLAAGRRLRPQDIALAAALVV